MTQAARDIPIIFSAPMIRALLRETVEVGTGKSMTRRLAWRFMDVNDNHTKLPSPWQRVKPGDRLWVRENFRNQQTSMYHGPPHTKNRMVCIDYAADDERIHWTKLRDDDCPKILRVRGKGESGKQTALLPCIHMPRQISRLTLVVTATKIERLQDISEQDCEREGLIWRGGLWHCPGPDGGDWHATETAIDCFMWLWRKINGAAAWDANPEVVALTFAVHKTNIDAMGVAA